MGEGETGQIIQREYPLHHSNVMHYSAAQKVRSRIGHKAGQRRYQTPHPPWPDTASPRLPRF
jgi:ribosomal protein L24